MSAVGSIKGAAGSARLRTIIEWKCGEKYMRHDLASGSDARFLNTFADRIAKISGPAHRPYWLKPDGTKIFKGPSQ